MRYKKTDFHIVFEDLNKFSLRVRKPFLKFFHRWVKVTYQETENSDELPLIFDNFEDAKNFVENIAD